MHSQSAFLIKLQSYTFQRRLLIDFRTWHTSDEWHFKRYAANNRGKTDKARLLLRSSLYNFSE